MLIGVTLVAEAFDHPVPKGYIYVAIAFSLFVEALNIRSRTKKTPVQLHEPVVERLALQTEAAVVEGHPQPLDA